MNEECLGPQDWRVNLVLNFLVLYHPVHPSLRSNTLGLLTGTGKKSSRKAFSL